MEDLPFRVTLSASGELDDAGIPKSLRFTIPAAVVKALGIKKGNSVFVQVQGIFKDETQKDPTPLDFPIWATVSSAGGSSLAVTVDKNEVKRYELEKDDRLEITMKVVKTNA